MDSSLIMSSTSLPSRLVDDHEECREHLVERIMDPGVCNPLIEWLVKDLYDFGLQPEVQNGKTIKLYAEYAVNWLCKEENALSKRLFNVLPINARNASVNYELVCQLYLPPATSFTRAWLSQKESISQSSLVDERVIKATTIYGPHCWPHQLGIVMCAKPWQPEPSANMNMQSVG
ncbi:hypothetical protein Sjap_003056 [Stephania japonica]|uniref:Uncharacterized protein n=1 Tax=Stephania japonica TaxID=461633 RepID=A0AAP0PWQ4_9MAGN